MQFDITKPVLSLIGFLTIVLVVKLPAALTLPHRSIRQAATEILYDPVVSDQYVHAIDVSSYTGPVTVPTWQNVKQGGIGMVVVSAWQGRDRKSVV